MQGELGGNIFNKVWRVKVSNPAKLIPVYIFEIIVFGLTFVDGFLIFSKEPKIIDNLIASLQKDFSLTDKGDIDKYLGIQVQTSSNGTTKLS